MKLKLTFKEGEIIPPSQFLAYIDEAPPKIETSGKKRRRVLVKDIRNNEIFEADFDSIRSGGTTSSPFMRSQLASERAKQNEAIKNSSQKRRKYNVGDIIGPEHNILVIDDFPPIITAEGQIRKKRKGIFKNIDTEEIFETTFNNVLCGFTYGMPLEEKSKGEYKVQSLLLEHNISFIREYIFEQLRINKYSALRFDFYLPCHNICIEYDGIQHYQNHFGLPEKEYQHQLENDQIKNIFCKENKIPLIRIPYYDYDKLDWRYLWDKIKLYL